MALIETNDYLSVRDAAKELGITHSYILKLIPANKFPKAIKPYHQWLIAKSDIAAFKNR